ncbi:O-methyltransferase [Paenibacillus nicotianae]|uniref:O-methyltransferase n=1 Tax=Paenibacillus nicotianae TaxID=1526551 RepID=A0ABW4UNT6_9BACL
MSTIQVWSQMDQYIEQHLISKDEVLEQVLKNNQQQGLPEYDVSAAQGKLLQLFVMMNRAKRILEIGTLGGYSTIWMARALPEDGRLITLEYDPHHAEVAGQNIKLAGLEDKVDIRIGDASEQLGQMETEQVEAFDMIFIDADKNNNARYLQYALQMSHPGTVIIGDNVVREGAILDRYSNDSRVQGIRQFYELLADDPRITATSIQTVGSKGYDGFTIGIVTDKTTRIAI